MNIWIINHYATPPCISGLVRHYYFSKYLTMWGHNVKIFTASAIHNTDINIVDDELFYKEEKYDDVEYTFLKTSSYSGNGFLRIKNMLEFTKKVRKISRYFEKPDIIYTSSPDLLTAHAALKLGKKLKVPVITEIRDLWPLSIVSINGISNGNPMIKMLYYLEKRIYLKSDSIIHTMPCWYNYIVDQGWNDAISKDKAYYINNGVDIKEYEQNVKKYPCTDSTMNDINIFKIVYAGSLRKAYRLIELVKLAKEIAIRGHKDIVFVFYGDGPEKETLQNYCKNYNVNNVYFKGKVEKKYIPGILAKSDINFISFSDGRIKNYGNSNNKLFEYLASGKPIISNLYFEGDIIEANNVGFNIGWDNIDKMIDVIIKLKNNQIFVKTGMELAKEYDYRVLAKEVEKALVETIEKYQKREQI